MATQEKTWNVANRLHSLKDSDNPEVNHIIAGADEIYDDTKGAKQSDINAQMDAALADRYTKSETYSKEQLDSLITTPDANYVTVATFADLPQTGEANTIYRVSSYDGTQVDASKYALYAWNGATYQLLAVRSAVGEVFDVSEYNSGATYETLTAALAAVPASVQRGGMSIKFILRTNTGTEEEPVYHDEYVQYLLKNTAWSITQSDWESTDGNNTIHINDAQQLTDAQKAQALANMGIGGIDDAPTANSDNLVRSGGVQNELALGAVYDVSAKNPTAGPNNDGKFESLSALLSDANLNTLIPTAVRKGGMSIKFIQSSDNKYAQFRLMSDTFNTTPSNWQGVDKNPTYGSKNLVESGGVTEVYGLLVSQSRETVQGQNWYNYFGNVNIKKGAKFRVKATGDVVFNPNLLRVHANTYTGTQLCELSINGPAATVIATSDIATLVCYRYGNYVSGTGNVTVELFIESDVVNEHLIEIKERLSNVDTEPTPESHKLIESGDIAKVYGDYENNEEYVKLLTDTNGKVIYGLRKDLSKFSTSVDKNVIEYINSFFSKYIECSVYERNKDKESNLFAACRYNRLANNQKDFQICIVTDTHTASQPIWNAVEAANKFSSIDAVIHLGDLEMFSKNDTPYNVLKTLNDIGKIALKPWFVVTGNHDVGATRFIYFNRTHEEVYNDLVKPMIDFGVLRSGEYQTTGDWNNRCYYFHDFNNSKVRLIVLYEYDWPLELCDSAYWDAIPYDSSLPMMQPNTTYTYDSSNPIELNCGGWKDNSFRLKQTVTTYSKPTTERTGTKMPGVKMRSCRYIGLEQINWFANVLNSTPDGYGVVIATHIPTVARFGELENSVFTSLLYSDNTFLSESVDILSNVPIIPEIVNAWKNKTTLNEKVWYSNNAYCATNGYDAEYVNILNDGERDYAYEISLDFSARNNNNCYFGGYLSGHNHIDFVAKSTSFPTQLNVCPCAGRPASRGLSANDVPNTIDMRSVAFDNFTIFSCNANRICLARIGNTKTTDGRDRDFEIININGN